MQANSKFVPFVKLLVGTFLSFVLIVVTFHVSVGSSLLPVEHFQSFLFSLIFFFRVSLITAVAYLLFEYFGKKIGLGVALFIFEIFLIIHFGLVGYQLESGILLGADVFGYSFTEITSTAGASGAFSLFKFFYLLLIIALPILGLSLLRFDKLRPWIIYGILLVGTLSWVVDGHAKSEAQRNEFTYYQIENPSIYFWGKTVSFWFGGQTIELDEIAQYPFVHEASQENPLGNWFNQKEELPNIVIIAVEGLGTEFVHASSKFGGATPFLDSLITKSLYWPNALSNSGRTFGVLPSLTGSLPYGKAGFMGKGVDMPEHHSLFSILKTNGYYNSYFYGGNANFDGQDIFLERNGIDYILDENKFPPQFKKMAVNQEGFSWGYGDKELFQMSLTKLPVQTPKLSFYMTLTTHEPFNIPTPEHRKFAKELSEKRSTNQKEYSDFVEVFGCLKYTDDALKEFMQAYSLRQDYANTVFIITGDHRLIPVPAQHRLDRYKVPLIIYSPLLKKPITSKQIVVHSQITPSLVSWLSNSYGISAPAQNSFISAPLAESEDFGSEVNVGLMRNKNEMEEYVSGTSLLSEGKLYTLNDQMEPIPNNDQDLLTTIKSELALFKAKSELAVDEDRLYPDSLFVMNNEEKMILAEADSNLLKSLNLLYSDSPDSIYFEARALAFDQKYVAARSVIQFGLTKSPNYHDMRVLLARTYAWSSQFDSAYFHLDETLRRAENFEDAYIAYADATFWADDLAKNREIMARGLKAYPASTELKARKARQLLVEGKNKEGIIILQEVLTSNPKLELAMQLKAKYLK